MLENVALCLQRGLLHCPRPSGLGRQEKGCSGCQLTFLKQFMGFQSSRGVSGVEQSQLPSRWRRKAGGTRKGRKKLRPGRVETLQPINRFSAEKWKANKALLFFCTVLACSHPFCPCLFCPCLPFPPGSCKGRTWDPENLGEKMSCASPSSPKQSGVLESKASAVPKVVPP